MTAGDAIGFANRDGRIATNKYDLDATELQHELNENAKYSEGLTPDERRIVEEEMAKVKPYTADLNDRERTLLQRERQLVKIITPDIVKNDTERNNKISYYASTQLPISEIEEVFNRIRTLTARTRGTNQYYGHSAIVQYNNNNAPEPTTERDEHGLTNLERQLKLLEWDI